MSEPNNKSYDFAGFRFDGTRRRLLRDGEVVPLSPKATDLLALLLSHGGKFVTKEDIFATIWPDTFIEDGVLTQNIYTLRKALGTNEHGDSLVETKSRLGYRISVPVNVAEITDPVADESTIDEIVFGDEPNEITAGIGTRNRKRFAIVMILIAVLILTTGFLGYRFFGSSVKALFRKDIQTVKFSRMTNSGDLSQAALSPDGKFIAFVRNKKVFLKDVVSNREIPLEIPGHSAYGSLQFSADGNFLYFCDTDTFLNYSRILKVSRFGGESVLVAERNLRRFALSPDNKFIVYYTLDHPDAPTRLVLKNLETQEMRDIYQFRGQVGYCAECSPAWSPDGKKILHVTEKLSNFTNQLFFVDVESGRNEEIKLPRLRRIANASWFPDGQSFALCASVDDAFQIFKVPFPAGPAQQITNGLESYQNPIVSADGNSILTIQRSETANVYVVNPSDPTQQQPLTTGNTNSFGRRALLWVGEKNVLFSGPAPNEIIDNFWVSDIDERAKRQITYEKEFRPNRPSSDGKSIYYNINRNRVANISRVDATGENRLNVTDYSEGARQSPQVSPDGKWLYYVYRSPQEVKVMRRDISSGQEESFIEDPNIQCGFFLSLSPDGRLLACPNWRAVSSDKNTEILIMSVENRAVLKSIEIVRSAIAFQFSPDNNAIDFISEWEGSAAIMRHALEAREAVPVVRLPDVALFNFAWSKTGKQLAISRGQLTTDAVLVTVLDQ